MGKNLSASPWLTAVIRAFRNRSPSKDNSITKQEELIGEEKKREKNKKKKIRWLFRKPTKADKREPTFPPPSREDCAAVSIQTAFRGFLARRALRALRGLVKLQALVRGYNVRKQAKTTLRCMQSLVRLQAHILNQRAAATLEDTRRRSRLEMQTSQRRHRSFGNEAESNTHFTPSPISRTKPSKVGSTSSPQYSREETWSGCNCTNATPPNHQSLPNYMATTVSAMAKAKAKAKAKARAQRQDVGLTVRKRLSYKGDGYGVSCSSGSTPSFKSLNGLTFRHGVVKVEQVSNYSTPGTNSSFVRNNVSPSHSSKSIHFIKKIRK